MTGMAVEQPLTVDRGRLKSSIVRVIRRGRHLFHPSVYEVDLDGRIAVWKDIGEANWIGRRLMGPVLLREAKVLQHLRGLNSVPAIFGVVDNAGFVMEKLEADCLPRRRNNYLSPAFFDALRTEILAMHKHGVAHGDLRRLNILVEKWTGRPRLIDFGTALLLDKTCGSMRRSFWRKLRRIDLMHYAKIKHSYFPDELTEEEKRWLAYAPWHYRIGHFYRWHVYKPFKRWRMKKSSGA